MRLAVALAVGCATLPPRSPAQDGGPASVASTLDLLGLNATQVVLAQAIRDPARAPAAMARLLAQAPAAPAGAESDVEAAGGAGPAATPGEDGGVGETRSIFPEEGPETSTITVEPDTAGETSTITAEPASSGAPPEPGVEDLSEITVEGVWVPLEVGPQRGLRLSRDQLPANVQSATGEEIREARATSITDFMNQNMQSVMINDYQGNPFQADLQFRGFTASPQIGTPQGLSVFFDGIRVNEPFGDVVNWDLIPLNAIGTFDVFPGSNPLFGLNTLGGALSIRTKNGFDDAGVHASLQGGSWGRIHGQLEGGGHYGPLGGFAAVTGFHEQGWRENSPSDVKQAFTKVSLRTAPVELDATMLLAGNDLVGNGLLPRELHEEEPSSVFTSPDETRNNLQQFSLSGLVNVTDEFNITAQVYRRQSDRRALGGDVYEEFSNMNPRIDGLVEARQPGGLPICAFADTNQDNVADFFIDNNDDLDGDGFGDADGVYDPALDGPINPTGLTSAEITSSLLTFFQPLDPFCSPLEYEVIRNADNELLARNGAAGTGAGIVEGTPIGVVTNTNIDQVTEGAALQLNFNLEKHRFMVGASIDANSSEYLGFQRLALIDESRNVFLAPEEIDPLYLAAREPIVNNQFEGTQTTQSAYFSETYSPFDNLHLTFAGRYNHTRTKNNLTARQNASVGDLHEFRDYDTARPDSFSCDSFLVPGDPNSGIDPSSCSTEVDFNAASSREKLVNSPQNLDERGRLRLEGTTEKYIYESFNPSFGINFLPRPDTNIFFNWSQGTRAPSVVELGCAYDPTLIDVDNNGTLDVPRGIANPNACTLPSTLSGDPFLPQVFARSAEIGMRGTLPNGWEWNGSVYRTNLYDDLYFVGGSRGQGSFQSIGDTLRQGFELGLSGAFGRWLDFNLNYGLTEALFQSQLYILSEHNSSRLAEGPGGAEGSYQPDFFDPVTGRALVQLEDMIDVQPGDRLPGVPLHNLNATMTFHPLESWDLSLNMVAHSSSFIRGNENNDHRAGTLVYVDQEFPGAPTEIREVYRFDGEVPGYVLFNLKTSYEVGKGLRLFGQVNNLLDKEYFSAGRLGINPFSPSTEGAIGPSGWNYNSLEWAKTSFIAPGAPRAYWIGLEYQF